MTKNTPNKNVPSSKKLPIKPRDYEKRSKEIARKGSSPKTPPIKKG